MKLTHCKMLKDVTVHLHLQIQSHIKYTNTSLCVPCSSVCVSVCVFVSPEGVLQISPVERGVVTLLGVRSRFFVAMNRRGKLYGSVSVPTFIYVFALIQS